MEERNDGRMHKESYYFQKFKQKNKKKEKSNKLGTREAKFETNKKIKTQCQRMSNELTDFDIDVWNWSVSDSGTIGHKDGVQYMHFDREYIC